MGVSKLMKNESLIAEKAALRKYPRTHEECFDLQIINILRAIQFDEPLMATGWDGVQTMRVIEKCYAHSELFRMPWLTPDRISRYETFFWKK